MKNKMLSDQEIKNNNNVFMSDELIDILQHEEELIFEEKKSFTSDVFVYLSFDEEIIKSPVSCFKRKNGIERITFVNTSLVLKKLLSNNKANCMLEVLDDVMFENSFAIKDITYKITLLENNMYMYSIDLQRS